VVLDYIGVNLRHVSACAHNEIERAFGGHRQTVQTLPGP